MHVFIIIVQFLTNFKKKYKMPILKNFGGINKVCYLNQSIIN